MIRVNYFKNNNNNNNNNLKKFSIKTNKLNK